MGIEAETILKQHHVGPIEDPEKLNLEEIEKNKDQRVLALFTDTFKYKVELNPTRKQYKGLREHTDRSVNNLRDNRRRAIELSYGLDGVTEPISDIVLLAKKLGVTVSKARSLLSQSKKNLRHPKRLGGTIRELGFPDPFYANLKLTK